jgi:hypothetical protein
MRVSFDLRSKKSKNSTAKMIMAVAKDARNVLIEIPSLFWPVPPACSKAFPRSSAAIAPDNGDHAVAYRQRRGWKAIEKGKENKRRGAGGISSRPAFAIYGQECSDNDTARHIMGWGLIVYRG